MHSRTQGYEKTFASWTEENKSLMDMVGTLAAGPLSQFDWS